MPRGAPKRNVHIPWISIQFGGINLAWRGEEGRPDYFTSLSHKRINDSANQLNVNVTYCPKIGEDPNKIEMAIYNSAGICTVQYGDMASNCSRLYKALVLGYTVTFSNGVLLYNFKMTSAAVTYNLTSYSHVPLDPEKGDNMSTFIDVLKEAAKCMEDKYTFEDPTSVLSSAKPITSKLTFSKNSSASPIVFIRDALKSIKTSNESTYFTIEIDDARAGKGVIRVVEVDPTKQSISYEFEWGTRDGTILSWAPKFDGAVQLQGYREQSAGEKFHTVVSQVNPDTGKIATVNTEGKLNFDIVGADDTLFVSDLIKDVSDFKKAADYAYQATLEVLGEGQYVNIGNTTIKVTPLIAGKPHHSAGNYIVKGVTDNVDSSGFTTTYDLLKKVDDKLPYSDVNHDNKDMIWVNGGFVPYEEYKPHKS